MTARKIFRNVAGCVGVGRGRRDEEEGEEEKEEEQEIDEDKVEERRMFRLCSSTINRHNSETNEKKMIIMCKGAGRGRMTTKDEHKEYGHKKCERGQEGKMSIERRDGGREEKVEEERRKLRKRRGGGRRRRITRKRRMMSCDP